MGCLLLTCKKELFLKRNDLPILSSGEYEFITNNSYSFRSVIICKQNVPSAAKLCRDTVILKVKGTHIINLVKHNKCLIMMKVQALTFGWPFPTCYQNKAFCLIDSRNIIQHFCNESNPWKQTLICTGTITHSHNFVDNV